VTTSLPAVFVGAPRVAPAVPFVKVCGLTRLCDVEAAVAAGASAIGFVFWPRSPRAVTIDVAARLRGALPAGVVAVGVFVDADADAINDTVVRVGLGAVQLHGDEAIGLRDAIGVPLIKAVVGGAHDAAWVDCKDGRVVLLVDARDDAQRGGTGRVADWAAAARLAAARPLVLAGGLTADNVARAVLTVGPVAVDVSSGVESAPGVKDARRLRAFFGAVRALGASEDR
jgi:phosphoribosylanthranilate isomerase